MAARCPAAAGGVRGPERPETLLASLRWRRRSSLVLRDEEEDGAPPHRTSIDLDGGTVVVRLP
ncbi:DUF6191 domain-containing protein [Streptomyces sp. SD15]